MTTSYALLVLPSANRVYAEASVGLALAELEVFNATVLGGRIDAARTVELGDVPYLAFEGDLTETDLRHLANLSTAFALFERVAPELDDGPLRPLPLARLDRFDDDLLTILKYRGKTNELFTKLLLNVTVLSSASASQMLEGRLRVLDPMCGRGTTLNQALMYGWDAAGVDVDPGDFEAYAAFLQTWLKRKRLKHSAEITKVRREGRVLGRRFDATVGLDKEAWKRGDALSVTMVHTDTTRAREVFRPGSFDVVVTDAPYGVQHGSRSGQGLRRDPLELLRAALPGWRELLRPGGAMGLSWNTHVAPRGRAVEALEEAGLLPLVDPPYDRFGHRVDQAIHRDILIATSPARG